MGSSFGNESKRAVPAAAVAESCGPHRGQAAVEYTGAFEAQLYVRPLLYATSGHDGEHLCPSLSNDHPTPSLLEGPSNVGRGHYLLLY